MYIWGLSTFTQNKQPWLKMNPASKRLRVAQLKRIAWLFHPFSTSLNWPTIKSTSSIVPCQQMSKQIGTENAYTAFLNIALQIIIRTKLFQLKKEQPIPSPKCGNYFPKLLSLLSSTPNKVAQFLGQELRSGQSSMHFSSHWFIPTLPCPHSNV